MQNKDAMQRLVIDLLKDKLPAFYYYHDYQHTLFVQQQALEIGDAEGCSDEEMDLLHTAALWHDTGYLNTHTQHEEEGCVLAKQYLPGYGYSATAIEKICGMIMATRLPQSPHTALEEIMADADLAYLGTDSAAAQADKLLKELQHFHPSLTPVKWNRTQLVFLRTHQYFTSFCRQYKEPGKQAYLQLLAGL
jgi:uncharacterized protein